MIGRLRGTLAIKQPPFLLIEVNGVGYEVQAPLSTIYQMPEVGNTVVLLTHFLVREDAQTLYGFYSEPERLLFRTLIKISGVGPKMALTILSGMEVTQFIECVHLQEAGPLVRLPGVGKKTAERLILEMKGKLGSAGGEGDNIFGSDLLQPIVRQRDPVKMVEEEAIAAMIALGYKPQEATRAVAKVVYEGANSQELIRRALQGLVKA